MLPSHDPPHADDRVVVGGNHGNVQPTGTGFIIKLFTAAQAAQLASEAAFYRAIHAEGVLSPFVSTLASADEVMAAFPDRRELLSSALVLSDATHGFDATTRSVCDIKVRTRCRVTHMDLGLLGSADDAPVRRDPGQCSTVTSRCEHDILIIMCR